MVVSEVIYEIYVLQPIYIYRDIGDLWDLCNTADIIVYSLPSLNRLALFVRIFFGK